MAGIVYVASVLIGIGAFVLFVLSVALAEGWMEAGVGTLYGFSDSAYSVFGVLASGASVGLWRLSKED